MGGGEIYFARKQKFMKARLTKSIFITALTLGMLGVVGAAYATVTINATAVTSDGALTLTGAGASTWSLSSGALDIDSAGALSLNSSAGAVNLGNDAVAQAINIGTGLAARTITVGNETGTTSVEIDSGTGAINIGNAIAKIITIGNTTGTTGLVFNVGTGGYDLNFVAGAELDITSAASTVTDGVLDINVDSAVTGGFEVMNLGLTVNDGATATDNFDALSITLTANDADADVFGIRLTAADGVAAAGSYEAGITIDNADATAASMTDAILITSSGVNLGVTDAIDVSAANILNAINIGANNIASTGTVTFSRADAGVVTLAPADDAGAADITLDALLTGAIIIGSADVTSVTITVDGATDGDLVLPLTSVSGAEMVNNTVTETQLAATLTFADADFVNLAAILHDDVAVQGLRLPNVGAAPSDPTGAEEGYIAWDETNNLLLVNTGAAWASAFNNTASLNTFTTTNTFTPATDVSGIVLTGTNVVTGTLATITSAALTTGGALSVTSTNTAIADTAAGISPVLLAVTNAQGTAAQTLGGGFSGLRVNFTNNPTIAGNTEYAVQIQNQVTANATDNAVTALLLLDNADTDAGGSTIITDALRITNSGAIAVGITDAIDVSAADIVNAINIGANNVLSTGTVTFSRADTGTVTLTAVDDNADAALTLSPGGTALLTLGDTATGTNAATVAIFSSDWEISATGAVTGVAFDANGTGNSLTNVDEADLSASSGTGLGVMRVARAKYDFAVDGGVVGAITPTLTATLPDNAVIVGGTINSTTAVTAVGAGTVSVGTTAGSSATSILGVTGKASLTADALLNSDITFAAPVKMTAAGGINITVAGDTLTAGVIEITLFYFVAGN